MQNMSVHKQRLITIIIAALILIFCFLPWQKYQGTTSTSMGFSIWGGIACAVLAAVVIATCLLMGNKAMPFDKQGKMIAIVCFALMFLLTIIVAVAGGTAQVQTEYGFILEVKRSAGIGAWLALILELGGLVWVTGILDKLMQSTAQGSMSSPPPPPPPPKV